MTTHPTDQSLKLALAKMLPEKIGIATEDNGNEAPFWLPDKVEHKESYDLSDELCIPIHNTEWLHVCWLIEQKLSITLPPAPQTESERTRYYLLLAETCGTMGSCMASWQQRAEALCKVKGVEV